MNRKIDTALVVFELSKMFDFTFDVKDLFELINSIVEEDGELTLDTFYEELPNNQSFSMEDIDMTELVTVIKNLELRNQRYIVPSDDIFSFLLGQEVESTVVKKEE